MKIEGSTKALGSVAALSATTALLYFISVYIPLVNVVIFLGAYLPIAYIYSKRKVAYATLYTIVTALILLIIGPIYSLTFIFTNAVIGLTLGYFAGKKESGIVVIGVLTIVTLLFTGIFLKIITLLTGVDILVQSIDSMINTVNMSIENLKSMGIESSIANTGLNPDDLKKGLMISMPGTALVSMAILSYIYYMISQKVLKRFGVMLEPVREFSTWYIPTKIAYPVMLLLLINIFITSEEMNHVGYAIRTIFLMVFTVNALATISYYLKNKNFPKALIGFILFLAFTLAQSIIVFIGLFEYALNIRGLDEKRMSIKKR